MSSRADVIETVERFWDQYPEMRLGQLLTTIAILSRGDAGADQVFDLENDEIVATIHRHLGDR